MARAPAGTAVAKAKIAGLPSTVSFENDLAELKNRLTKPAGDKIKVEDKQFTLPSGEVLDFLDIVVVDFVYFNAYYESAYEKGTFVPPTCFALHPEPKGIDPSANSIECQSQAGCDGCWANQFGSSGKGKACQNRCLIAVLPTNAVAETPLTVLDLSPTAVKPFSAYVASVARGLQRPPYGVVSHVECNPAVKYDVIQFSDPQPIDDGEFIAMIRSRRDEARQRLLTEPDVSAIKAANDSPKKSNLKAPAKRRA